jgi:hypothetical protein
MAVCLIYPNLGGELIPFGVGIAISFNKTKWLYLFFGKYGLNKAVLYLVLKD